MSYVRVWVHLVFSTKNRQPFLTKSMRYSVFQHIADNCKEKDIFLQAINGHIDHIHCLISLGKEQSISQIAQLIKGESSFWINKNELCNEHFEWQKHYYAVSVSESIMPKVVSYIKNQEIHHAKKTFEEEEMEFIEKYGFVRLAD